MLTEIPMFKLQNFSRKSRTLGFKFGPVHMVLIVGESESREASNTTPTFVVVLPRLGKTQCCILLCNMFACTVRCDVLCDVVVVVARNAEFTFREANFSN